MSDSISKYQDRENYVVPMTVEQKGGHLHAVILGEMAQDHITGKRVLHAGCNAATTTYHLWPMEPTYLAGVDVNVEAIQLAKETLPQGHFFHASIAELPFENSSFDTIIIFAVFEHLFEEDKAKAVAEFRRVLRPGGSLLVELPRAIPGSKDQKRKQNAYDPHHLSFYHTEDDVHADFPDPDWKCLKFYFEDRRNPNNNAQHCCWIAIYKNQKGPDEDQEKVEPEVEAEPQEAPVSMSESDIDLRDLGHESIRFNVVNAVDEWKAEAAPQQPPQPPQPPPQPEAAPVVTEEAAPAPAPAPAPEEAEEAEEAEPKSAQIRSPFGYGNPHDY